MEFMPVLTVLMSMLSIEFLCHSTLHSMMAHMKVDTQGFNKYLHFNLAN